MAGVYMRRSLLGLMGFLALMVAGCSSPQSVKTPTHSYLLSRWRGYLYVVSGQRAYVSLPLGVFGQKPVSLSLVSVSGPASGQLSFLGGSGDSYMTSFSVTFPEFFRSSTRVALLARFTIEGHRDLVDLGNWTFDLLPATTQGPVSIVSQSGGLAAVTLPSTYDLFVSLAVPRPRNLKDLSLVFDAPSSVVQADMGSPAVHGRHVDWSGVLHIRNRRSQLYLVPALRYVYGNQTFEIPLRPIVISAVPAPSSARLYGMSLK